MPDKRGLSVLDSGVVDAVDALRDAEIRALDLIGQQMPDVLDRLVRVAVAVTGAAVAEIHVITSTHQHTLASTDQMRGPCPAADSYCARIVRETEHEHVVPDTRLDDRFRDSPFTTSGAVVTYGASQLVTSVGVPVGTLCVFDPAEKELGASMMNVLSMLSAAAMDVLETRRQHHAMQDSLSELSGAQRELRRSNEHLAAFAGQVCHDVQGPLASVLMSLQLIEEGPGENSVEREMLLQRALSGAQRMRRTIGGLMEFALVGGSLARVRLDLDGVVAQVLEDLDSRLGRTRVVVGDLPEVWGDDVQVRAVIQNLVANALKYAGHVPDPVVRITGAAHAGCTRISVSDNGPGVAEHQREAIFGLLVRGEATAGSGVEGLGIGLATCRRIVEAHGGGIGVSTSTEGGAEFWFDLPILEETD